MPDEQDLDSRIAKFIREVGLMEIEFNAFFLTKKLLDYCEIKINRAAGNFSIEIKRNDLPLEIIDRITVAYLTANQKK